MATRSVLMTSQLEPPDRCPVLVPKPGACWHGPCHKSLLGQCAWYPDSRRGTVEMSVAVFPRGWPECVAGIVSQWTHGLHSAGTFNFSLLDLATVIIHHS